MFAPASIPRERFGVVGVSRRLGTLLPQAGSFEAASFERLGPT